MSNPLMPGGNEKVACTLTQLFCLSMCDLFVTTRHKRVNMEHLANKLTAESRANNFGKKLHLKCLTRF